MVVSGTVSRIDVSGERGGTGLGGRSDMALLRYPDTSSFVSGSRSEGSGAKGREVQKLKLSSTSESE
jgi:hypothetical protein